MNHETDTPRTDASKYSTGIIDLSRQLERELAEKTNEVARLRELLQHAIENCEYQSKCASHFAVSVCELIELLDEAEAKVERLTKRPFGCKCETLREKALGDGCDECNKALVIEMLTDERNDLKAEVERLTEKVAERDQLVEASDYIAKEEAKILQRWKDWGLTKQEQLNRAVEIAETSCKYLNSGGWNEDELYSGKGGWVTETEIDEVCATLAALKGELK